MVVPLEEDQESIGMEVEEDAVDMIVRVPVPGHRSMIIELDFGNKEEMDKTKTKAKATHRSNHLWGPRG